MLLITSFAICTIGCAVGVNGSALGAGNPSERSSQLEQGSAAPQMVFAVYLPDYAIDRINADTIDLRMMTDIIYFGLNVTDYDPGEAIKIDPQHKVILKQLQERSGCRLLLCAGGWGRSGSFAEIAAEPAKRQAFIRALLNFCRTHGFNGIDYDWEHPQNQQQIADYADLVAETAKAFQEPGLIVTVAVAAWQDLGQKMYRSADRMHLMSYDHRYPHATMEHARGDVERLLDSGCPAEKIVLGIPFYGRNEQGHARSYRQLIEIHEKHAIPNVVGGYAHNDPSTVENKTRWAIDRGLAGIMAWELNQDSHDQALLQAVRRGASAVSKPAAEGQD